MKLSELINKLETLKEENGDIDVVIYRRFDGRDSYFKDDDVDIMVDDDKNIIYL